jgi:hypothetical protein
MEVNCKTVDPCMSAEKTACHGVVCPSGLLGQRASLSTSVAVLSSGKSRVNDAFAGRPAEKMIEPSRLLASVSGFLGNAVNRLRLLLVER